MYVGISQGRREQESESTNWSSGTATTTPEEVRSSSILSASGIRVVLSSLLATDHMCTLTTGNGLVHGDVVQVQNIP